MRNFILIGQIKGAKSVSRKNKTTGSIDNSVDVIIQYEDYDKDGDLILDTDTISFDISELEILKSSINKFIVIPFIYMVVKSGTYMFRNENMNYNIFDTYPLLKITENKSNTNKLK